MYWPWLFSCYNSRPWAVVTQTEWPARLKYLLPFLYRKSAVTCSRKQRRVSSWQESSSSFFPLKNDNHKIKHKKKNPNICLSDKKQYSIAGMGKQQPVDQIQPTAGHMNSFIGTYSHLFIVCSWVCTAPAEWILVTKAVWR